MTLIVLGVLAVLALTFAAAGANAPHWHYGPFVPTVVNKIRQIAATQPAAINV